MKIKTKKILSATEIRKEIKSKFKLDNKPFWEWFFSESPWGETNLISLDKQDEEDIFPEFLDYFKLIKKEYRKFKVNDVIEIENDF